jgi:hypothetical protein
MSKSLAVVCALAACGFCFPQEPQPKQELEVPKVTKEKPMSFWMSKKLDYSKNLLEGLTSGDFKSIEAYATQMRTLGKIEGFVRSGDPAYVAQLQMFDMSNTEMIVQAQKKNIEGVTLAFNHMTSSCVACHSWLRKE